MLLRKMKKKTLNAKTGLGSKFFKDNSIVTPIKYSSDVSVEYTGTIQALLAEIERKEKKQSGNATKRANKIEKIRIMKKIMSHLEKTREEENQRILKHIELESQLYSADMHAEIRNRADVRAHSENAANLKAQRARKRREALKLPSQLYENESLNSLALELKHVLPANDAIATKNFGIQLKKHQRRMTRLPKKWIKGGRQQKIKAEYYNQEKDWQPDTGLRLRPRRVNFGFVSSSPEKKTWAKIGKKTVNTPPPAPRRRRNSCQLKIKNEDDEAAKKKKEKTPARRMSWTQSKPFTKEKFVKEHWMVPYEKKAELIKRRYSKAITREAFNKRRDIVDNRAKFRSRRVSAQISRADRVHRRRLRQVRGIC